MTRMMKGSALALPLLLLAAPAALAHSADLPADPATGSDPILALGLRPDAHGPAGTMADHVHKAGDLMVAVSWMHEDADGANRRGTQPIDDAAIAAAGYHTKARSMTMDMAMLHVMYAPSDRVSLMVVPSWMRMGMTMTGLPDDGDEGAGSGAHAGHSLLPGESMSHSVEGIGDTQFGALVALSRRPALSVHAALMLSAPTGNTTRRNADGSYVHYMMQGGSGTWDLNPSLTVHGAQEHFGWGAQIGYLFRAQDRNAAGFRFGDRFSATAWLSAPVSARASVSARLAWSDEGKLSGHYNGAHSHAAPPDRQANYGGRRLDAALGANVMVGQRLRLGAEAGVPLYQDVNGIQPARRWSASSTVAVMF